jgi:hypothetical protein
MIVTRERFQRKGEVMSEEAVRDQSGRLVFPEGPTVIVDGESNHGLIIYSGWQIQWFVTNALGSPQWWVWLRQWIQEGSLPGQGSPSRWKVARSDILGSSLKIKDVSAWLKGLQELGEGAEGPVRGILTALDEVRLA